MSSLPDLFRAAHTDYEAGPLAQAEQGFLRLLAACPGHPGALYFFGAIAYQQARYAVAANYFSQAVAANPKDATFHSGLGAAYQALGRLAEALLCHQQARRRTGSPDRKPKWLFCLSILTSSSISIRKCYGQST